MGSLILIRHGQSAWNAAGRFTGWVDVPLSDTGRAEVAEAGAHLAAEGHRVDAAFTSTLRRAIETGEIVLDALGQRGLRQQRAWELNERYYGALTGRRKADVEAEFGAAQVLRWRRGYDVRPPGGESVADTARRTVPYVEAAVLPAARRGTVLVSAHGNSLRTIVQRLEALDGEAVAALAIPTGVAIVYRIDHLGRVRGHGRIPGGDGVAPADRR